MSTGRYLAIMLLALLTLGGSPGMAWARVPPPVEDIGISERIGSEIPTALRFRDHKDREVALSEYFDGKTPVVLVLAYVRCATLCNLVLRGVADAVRQSRLALGEDYRVVTVSIDPRESAVDSTSLRDALLQLAEKSPDASWDYLTAEEEEIATLAASLGFGYRWDERTQQYAHPAVVFVASGEGRVMRYLYGLQFPDHTLDLAVQGAARGEAALRSTEAEGGPLSCFRFDPSLRAHWALVARYFAIGGLLLIALVGGGIGFLLRRERRNRE